MVEEEYEGDEQVVQAGEGYEVKGLYGYVGTKITGLGAYFAVLSPSIIG